MDEDGRSGSEENNGYLNSPLPAADHADMDSRTLWTLLILAVGAGIFLRLVGREKHRRERHLQFRLEEQVRKLKEQQDLEAEQARSNSDPLVVRPR